MSSFFRNIFLLLIMFSFSKGPFCQSFKPSDLIRQNKKQREVLLEQIAANNAYLKILKNGNDILDFGVKITGLSKEKDFFLHANRFERLSIFNPLLLKSSIIKRLADQFRSLWNASERIRATVFKNQDLLKKEKKELFALLNEMGAVADKEMNSFDLIFYDYSLKLNDADRIDRINGIYSRLQNVKGSFCRLEERITAFISAKKRLRIDENILRSLLSSQY